jgi:hypothetical protein
MLSYTKHGKFPALIQAAPTKIRRKKAPIPAQHITLGPVPPGAVDHGMGATANAPPVRWS